MNEDTSKIVLNALDLDIAPAKLVSDALKEECAQLSPSIDKAKGRATFAFAKTLPKGSKARLSMPFAGTLTDNMIGACSSVVPLSEILITHPGYYLSAYELDGNKKYVDEFRS